MRAITAICALAVETAAPHLKADKVLLAEDNPINRMMASQMMRGMVQHLTMVETGKAALEALERETFDLVLMDIQMPEMSGIEAIAAIRSRPSAYRNVPVIALTANALITDRDRFLSAGFSDYLSKPFRRADLRAMLRKWGRDAPSRPAGGPSRAERSPAPAGRDTAPDVFNAAQFADNFSVFSREEQLEILQEARTQLTAEARRIVGVGGIAYAGSHGAELLLPGQAQAELVSSHIAKQDIVITTALIPGRAAPRLISDAQIASMKPGSVIFDLAVAQGGNVEGSKADEVVVKHGVKIIGYSNTPAHLAADASALFARNLFNFLSAFWDKEAGRPVLPDEDEITAAIRLTKDGKVVNERLLG